jgi:hypothetical protein
MTTLKRPQADLYPGWQPREALVVWIIPPH